MENNKAYLQKLPQIFLAVLIIICFQQFMMYDDVYKLSERTSPTFRLIMEITYNSTLFVALGYALNKWKAALIAIASSIVITMLDMFLFAQLKLENYGEGKQAFFFITISFIYYLPYFVFFLAQKFNAKTLLIIFLVVLATRCFNHVFSVQPSYSFLNKFIDNRAIAEKIGGSIVYTVLQVFRFLFFCEIQNYAMGKTSDKNTKLLNPGNEYSTGAGIITFWVVKTFTYAMVIGTFHQLSSLRNYFSSFWDAGGFQIFYYQSIIHTIFCLGVILFAAWYLRKMILEYFISHNITSRFLYWLTLIPVVGFIVWLFLLEKNKVKSYAEKVSAIDAFASSESKAVTVIFIVSSVLQFLYVVTVTRSGTPVLYLIIDIGLFFWMISSETGYRATLWLRIIAFLTLLVFLFIHPVKETAAYVSVIYPFLLFSIFQLVMIFPVFHFENFGDIPLASDETGDGTSGDLLQEFGETPDELVSS